MIDPHPTTAKLRHDIDRGRGGDKVDAVDHAVAPLGTDDEAAGTSPSPRNIASARAHEIGPIGCEQKADAAVPIFVGAIIALFGLLVLAAIT
jgi:hypothetical protein